MQFTFFNNLGDIIISFFSSENSSGTYANLTTTVMLPEVQPTLLRQNVDYSFYFVLMGMCTIYLRQIFYRQIHPSNRKFRKC